VARCASPDSMAPTKPGHFELVMALLAILGIARAAYFHLSHPNSGLFSPGEAIDPAYTEILRDLPDQQRLGFLSDVSPSFALQDRYYLQASYALVPHRLEREPSTLTWVVARFEDPVQLELRAARYHLAVVARYQEGHVALLRRKGSR
jgi:hypothetical protein